MTPMAKKTKARRKPKRSKTRRASKAKAPRKKAGLSPEVFNSGMHDFTNLATALRAYLELLSTQGTLDDKQKYYVARSREQVEMLIDLVRELKEKL